MQDTLALNEMTSNFYCVQHLYINPFCNTKMKKYTVNKSFRISETQAKTLEVLSDRGIDVSKFIRLAIQEKITKDYDKLKPKRAKEYCPF